MDVITLYQIFPHEWSGKDEALCGAVTKELAESIFYESYPHFSSVPITWRYHPDKKRYPNTWCYDGWMEVH